MVMDAGRCSDGRYGSEIWRILLTLLPGPLPCEATSGLWIKHLRGSGNSFRSCAQCALGQRCESDHRPLRDRLAAGHSSRRKSRTFHVGNFLIASVLQGRRGAASRLRVDFAINTACYRVQAAVGRPSFPPIAVQTFDAGLSTAADRLLSLTSHGSSCFQQRRMFTLGMPGCPFIKATAGKPEKLCRIFGLKGPTRLCRCRAYAVSQSPI